MTKDFETHKFEGNKILSWDYFTEKYRQYEIIEIIDFKPIKSTVSGWFVYINVIMNDHVESMALHFHYKKNAVDCIEYIRKQIND